MDEFQGFPELKTVLSINSGAKADMLVSQGDKLHVGHVEIEVRETPGRSSGLLMSPIRFAGSLTFVVPSAKLALVGNALMLRGCGDFQKGFAELPISLRKCSRTLSFT